jgi:hypothetical protein
MQNSMNLKTIVAGVLVGLAAIAVGAVLLGCGSSDDPSADPFSSAHQNYHQKQYAVAIANSWPADPSDLKVGDYLETSWHYPVTPVATFTVYSRTADETGSPEAAADLARVQMRRLPDYHERGMEKIEIRDTSAVRWSFDLADTVYVEYFFEECGIDLVARGSAPADTWGELASFFPEMATSITANCD